MPADGFFQQKHIPSINILGAHSRSVFKGLSKLLSKLFLMENMTAIFTFWNLTVALYIWVMDIEITVYLKNAC